MLTVTTERAVKKGDSHRIDIQGLRAVAVLLVVLYHARVSILSGGYVGVDVFFVISGYLITSHLLRSLQVTGRIKFLDFYARRIRRLVPAALLVIVVTLIASIALLPPLRALAIARDAAASTAYVPNMWFAFTGTDYLTEKFPSPFQQYWSLGVEEQFYLLWPFILVGLWFASKRSPKILAIFLFVLVGLSLALSVLLTQTYGPWAFFTLPTRAWEFGIGGLVAILHLTKTHKAIASGAWSPALATIGLGMVVLAGFVFTSATPFPGYAALLPVGGTALLIAFSHDSQRSVAKVLRTKPMTYIGDISYSLYLWHWPVIIIPVTLAGGSLPLWQTLLLAALCVPLAHLTYKYVENWARLSPKWKAIRPSRFLPAAILVTALMAGAMFAAGSVLDKRLIASSKTASAVTAGAPILFTAYVPANAKPRLQQANFDVPKASKMGCSPDTYDGTLKVCEFGNTASPKTYVLFGDSHAAQWFPAAEDLATAQEARLLVMIKAGCASINVPRYETGSIDPFCEKWKASALQRIQNEKPDLVMMANLHVRQGVDGENVTSETWNNATKDTLGKMPSEARVAVLADTPWFSTSPVQCASLNVENLETCAIPRDEVIDPRWVANEKSSVEASGAAYVDMTDTFCTDKCSPVIGDTLVFRDTHHLTATFVKAIAEPFRERLAQKSVL